MKINGNNHVIDNETLLKFLLLISNKEYTKSHSPKKSKGKDVLIISKEAQELFTVNKSGGRTVNTNIDKSIDLKKYIKVAKDNNEEVLKNVGNSINVNAVKYTDYHEGLRSALTDKYTRLVQIAKTHSDPLKYIYEKYNNSNSFYYEKNLSPEERSAGYINELNMYENGKLSGINYQDSLLRGNEIYGNVTRACKLSFERQVINNQISNIIEAAGIDKSDITDKCSFTVDPYSYEIFVSGVSNETKIKMEQALNVGNNGRNLFYHINNSTSIAGADSSQNDKIMYQKYRAYHDVYDYTGLKLNELTEKNGSYYTSDGIDVLKLANKSIMESKKIPENFKVDLIIILEELVSKISSIGWNNIKDMPLSIHYPNGELRDAYQTDNYTRNSDWYKSNIGDAWYAVF